MLGRCWGDVRAMLGVPVESLVVCKRCVEDHADVLELLSRAAWHIESLAESVSDRRRLENKLELVKLHYRAFSVRFVP